MPRVEEKLDNILGMLQTGGIIPPPPNIINNNHQPAANVVRESSGLFSRDLDNHMPSATTQLTPETNSLEFPGDHSSRSSVRDVPLTLAQAEKNQMAFQNQKSKYLPFIYIPATTTAEQLRL